MVTCSLNGGAGERRPKNSISRDSGILGSNHFHSNAAGVACMVQDEERKVNGTASSQVDCSAPMVLVKHPSLITLKC